MRDAVVDGDVAMTPPTESPCPYTLIGIILSFVLISTALLTFPLWGPYIVQATPRDVPDHCAVVFKNGTVISGGGNNICVHVVDNTKVEPRSPTMLEEACCDPDPYTRAFACDRVAMESLCQQNYTEFCNVTVDCAEVRR